MKKQRIRLPVKQIVIIAIVIAFAIPVFIYLSATFKKANFFNIEEILCTGDCKIDLSYLKGRNIFSVDLAKQSRYLSDLFPLYSRIRLIRVLPNRIFVDFVKRKPIACVSLYRYFYVDKDSFLFNLPSQEDIPTLPLIVGLETKIFGPKPGNRYNIRELELALEIINEINANSVFKNCEIKKIDVSSISNASFFMALPVKDALGKKEYGVIEVRLGGEDIKGKINILGNLLNQLTADRYNIKYVDLRFKEPTIKLKDKDVQR